MALASTIPFGQYLQRAPTSLTPDYLAGNLDGVGVKVPKDAPFIDAYYRESDNFDWALAMARAHAASPIVRLQYGQTYPFKTTFRPTSSLILDGSGATIEMAADICPIIVDFAYLNESPISSIAVQSIDLSGGTSGPTPVSVLTLPSAAGYAADDVIKVVSDDLMAWVDPDDDERHGEYATVSQVVGNDVFLRSVLTYGYPTNARVARLDLTKEYHADNVNFALGSNATTAWNEDYMQVYGCAFGSITRLRTTYGPSGLLTFYGCYRMKTDDFDVRNTQTDASLSKFGYGLVSYSSTLGVHTNHYAENARHLYTDGTRGVDAGGDMRLFGQASYDLIANCTAFNMQNTGLDTHGSGKGHHFENCVVVYAFNGPTGTRQCFAFRGHDHTASNCDAYGGHGFVAFTSYGHPDNSGGHVFTDCRYFQNPNADAGSRNAFRAIGRAGEDGNPDSIVTARFVDCKEITYSGNTPSIYAERANIEVVSPDIKRALTSDSTALVEATTSSTITLRGSGTFNPTGSAGAAQTVFKMTTADSIIKSSGSHSIEGGAAIDGIVNANLIASTAYLFGIDSDVTFASPTLGTSGGAVIALDYTTNGGRTSGYSTRTPTTLVAGANTLDISYRSAKTLYVRLRALAAGCEITDATVGNVFGQIWIITNRGDSSDSITIKNSGLFSIGSDIVLAVGAATQVIWDGTNLVRAQ